MTDAAEIGPVEYLIVAFPGNRFRGEIAPALADLVEAGTIRIIARSGLRMARSTAAISGARRNHLERPSTNASPRSVPARRRA